MANVKRQYKMISENYQGRCATLISEKRELEKALEVLEKQTLMTIAKYEREIEILNEKLESEKESHKKSIENLNEKLESEKEKHELELRLKNTEIESLKKELKKVIIFSSQREEIRFQRSNIYQ